MLLECSLITRIVPKQNENAKIPKIVNNKAPTDKDVLKWLKF